jgi:hypothetical protein
VLEAVVHVVVSVGGWDTWDPIRGTGAPARLESALLEGWIPLLLLRLRPYPSEAWLVCSSNRGRKERVVCLRDALHSIQPTSPAVRIASQGLYANNSRKTTVHAAMCGLFEPSTGIHVSFDTPTPLPKPHGSSEARPSVQASLLPIKKHVRQDLRVVVLFELGAALKQVLDKPEQPLVFLPNQEQAQLVVSPPIA